MLPLNRLLASCLCLATAHSAGAQSVGVPGDTAVVAWSALSERSRLQDTSHTARVRFPSMMASAHVAGEVHLEMIVGADGLPERSSIRVVSSTHDLFSNSVRYAILDWRLTAPMVNGRAVRARVPVRVSFLLPPQDEPSRETSAVVIDSSGFHISLGRQVIPRQVGLVSNRADSSAAIVAALAELLSTARSTKASALCVSLGEQRRMSADVLKRVRVTHPEVRDPAHCPRTYTSMVLHVDSLGKPILPPNGALDPVWVSTSKVQPWTSDLFVVHGSVAQGTSTSWYQCQVRREQPGGAWKAACDLTSFTVSVRSLPGVWRVATWLAPSSTREGRG